MLANCYCIGEYQIVIIPECGVRFTVTTQYTPPPPIQIKYTLCHASDVCMMFWKPGCTINANKFNFSPFQTCGQFDWKVQAGDYFINTDQYMVFVYVEFVVCGTRLMDKYHDCMK